MPQRKYFVATDNLVFDFELFIGELVYKRRADKLSYAIDALPLLTYANNLFTMLTIRLTKRLGKCGGC
jgi:hypothetical protein